MTRYVRPYDLAMRLDRVPYDNGKRVVVDCPWLLGTLKLFWWDVARYKYGNCVLPHFLVMKARKTWKEEGVCYN